MIEWINLHRHGMMSLFDGFGRHDASSEHAKELGQKALGLTDHGTVSGLMGHYRACKDVGIKPILGVEAYFQPEFDPKMQRFHLVLLAKNLAGYKSLMRMVSEANVNNFFRVPIVDSDILKRNSEGIICTSACATGLLSMLITSDADSKVLNGITKYFKDIFGDDFYLEVLPVKFELQYKINEQLIELGKKTKTKVVLTFDSHFIAKEDYDTYLMMHKLRGVDFQNDYSERFMPSGEEVTKLWYEMHPSINPTEFISNSVEIADKCDVEFNFENMVPKLEMIDGQAEDSRKEIVALARKRLMAESKTESNYKDRLVHELNVVFSHGFEDYFLLCRDIVYYAKRNGIRVGPGRGSVGGSLLAYALGITDVDPIKLGTSFERFLRKDKKKLPDIDIDFESSRRSEVTDYILQKYRGRAAQITTFGFYKVRNLINDLAKVLEMGNTDKIAAKQSLETIVDSTGGNLVMRDLENDHELKYVERNCPGFIKHFYKLYNQVRFIGKHAAGVAITPDDITNYVALRKIRGFLQTSYDLRGLEEINVLKMDILGLSTLSVIDDTEGMVGNDVKFSDNLLNDSKIYDEFCKGNTAGVFQFEKSKARDLLKKVNPRNFQELIACNSLNRPAPIKLGVVDEYINGKTGDVHKKQFWYKYTEDTYGTLIYQEQVMAICRNIGNLSWDDTDIVMKMLKKMDKTEMRKKFVIGAVSNGFNENEAAELFEKMTLYLFNKSHGAGYSIISFYCMYLKTHYPLEFYCALIKNEADDMKLAKYLACASNDDIVILLPHVNSGLGTKIVNIDGERAISLCISLIKGVGKVTAKEIDEHKPYKSIDDFKEKVNLGKVNVAVVEKLKEQGALIFDPDVYLRRVVKFNSGLKLRSVEFY
ncbi:MAG TPA: DNA polymerase III subunit alpha [Candidatus Glassbacteria bacterium]|nr:DNA polymerase III subunit alpha [Candidatus Glassbacteria bacterium]